MSLFTPARRWQPAFFPFRREKFINRFRAKIELLVKGPLFGCRMCGNCLLQETAFICPMECPKGLRNGPCGGSTSVKCYVDETRKCIWYEIYKRAVTRGKEEKLLEVLPPLDWNKAGTETWGDVIKQIRKVGTGSFFYGLLSEDRGKRSLAWNSVFRSVRQPEWWQGDSEYHPVANNDPVSELERRLRSGKFVVTTEIAPPSDANSDKLKQKIELVKPYVAAINFTDCSSVIPKMSSIACSKVAYENKADPVLQLAARDKTRTGLQSEIVGVNEMGVHNVLCITGDSPKIGPAPIGNLNIFDLDSVQMLWILRRLRDDGIYLDGRRLESPPKLFLGAAASPFASEPAYQAIREHKKVNAGAQFFQTNLVFDPDGLDRWLEQLDKRNILNKVYILVGITALKSYKMAQYLHYEVPGVTIPEILMKRIEKAGDSAKEEGIKIALEIIAAVKQKKGVNGIHLMPIGWESIVPRLVKEAGII